MTFKTAQQTQAPSDSTQAHWAEMERRPPVPCACCGTPSSPYTITGRALCDAHFAAWVKFPRPPTIGAQQGMADFVEKHMTPEWRKRAA